ncbi:MAG: heterodisulfide reductase [Chloroflexi bacterium]|nr:heterodisulfide reductase [Chloroflexota bacterium]
MQYLMENKALDIDKSFSEQVKEASGTEIGRCYQCLTCSLGCPSAFAMDYLPHQIVKMVQLGLRQPVLSSATIWVCADCQTCATRCPNEVNLVKIMDVLRETSLREGLAREHGVTDFHRIFLDNIRRWGRQHELSLIIKLKLKTRDPFSDLSAGVKMMLKGKLKLLPARFREIGKVRDIFKGAEG